MAPTNVTMALPVVRNLLECAQYPVGVEPYIYRLRELPQLLWNSATDPAALKQIYIDTNPLISAFAFALALSPIFLVAAEVNRNWSQIDRFWSILPNIYNVHYVVWAHLAGISTGRLDFLVAATTIWSARLTFNYWRRGGYKIGSEDYRWEIIKDYIGPVAFFFLDITFISLGQNLIFALVTSPTYILLLKSRLDTSEKESALQPLDLVFFATMLALVALTAVADQQQWNYQTAKYSYRKTAKIPAGCGFTSEELDRGFLTKGLFAHSRHPNYAAEQAVWWTLYFWSCAATKTQVNWSVIGPIAYTLVFQGSTPITEWITVNKYPEYKEYQAQCGRFLPKFMGQEPVFESKSPKKQKRISNETDADSSAREKNAADYAQAKKRYNLR